MRLLTSVQIKLSLLPRMGVAVVLVLALLSGIAPFKSASAGNLCTMACCAGLPPHAAGSCHMEMAGSGKLAPEPSPETADELCGLSQTDVGAVQGVVAGVMGMTTTSVLSLNLEDVTVDAPEDPSAHCLVNSETGAVGSSADSNSEQAANIAAHSLAKPCPPECGSGLNISRVRRTPDPSTVARNARPRSTFGKQYFYQSHDCAILAAYREQVQPRGPPPSLS